MTEAFTLQAVFAIIGIAVFSLVWLGLATSIRKISQREANPPSFNLLLNAAHLGRFAGWALVGAAALQIDFWTGVMLLVTRIPAVLLVAITFLQRRELRPSAKSLLTTLLPVGFGLIALCSFIAMRGIESAAVPIVFGIELPESTPVQYATNLFVLACFAVQVLYALPQQILEAREKPLGNLRWFQMSLLANYGYTLLYSFLVQDALVQLVMRGAYSLVFIEQAILVVMIERAIARKKSSKKASSFGSYD